MDEDKQTGGGVPANEVLDELKELGRNLKSLLKTAWESEERKKLQQEIESGLNELSASLKQAANEFSTSPTGQTLKSDFEDLHKRIKTGEVEMQIRNELLTALRTANEDLKKAATPKTIASEESNSQGSGETV